MSTTQEIDVYRSLMTENRIQQLQSVCIILE